MLDLATQTLPAITLANLAKSSTAKINHDRSCVQQDDAWQKKTPNAGICLLQNHLHQRKVAIYIIDSYILDLYPTLAMSSVCMSQYK